MAANSGNSISIPISIKFGTMNIFTHYTKRKRFMGSRLQIADFQRGLIVIFLLLILVCVFRGCEQKLAPVGRSEVYIHTSGFFD